MAYRDDYPKEPIGGSNPYMQCASCQRSTPEINGSLERHYPFCAWRREQERLTTYYNLRRAVNAALAEYDNPHKSITSTTAHNMADILRRALNGEAGA